MTPNDIQKLLRQVARAERMMTKARQLAAQYDAAAVNSYADTALSSLQQLIALLKTLLEQEEKLSIAEYVRRCSEDFPR